jgi:hypothetical protein
MYRRSASCSRSPDVTLVAERRAIGDRAGRTTVCTVAVRSPAPPVRRMSARGQHLDQRLVPFSGDRLHLLLQGTKQTAVGDGPLQRVADAGVAPVGGLDSAHERWVGVARRPRDGVGIIGRGHRRVVRVAIPLASWRRATRLATPVATLAGALICYMRSWGDGDAETGLGEPAPELLLDGGQPLLKKNACYPAS